MIESMGRGYQTRRLRDDYDKPDEKPLDMTPAQRAARVELYRQRVAEGLDIWTGEDREKMMHDDDDDLDD